jgi:methionyl-tRNA synthetase
MKKRLITSALPYVNNIPHLGNLIQVLSADVFARFCRQYGYETLYVCGTDEYGTATETRAIQEGVTPKELCDHYNKIHTDIYDWFNIAFDEWGRTSTPEQTEIVQHIFNECDRAGFIREQEIEQLFCESCDRFLADRYVHGECPHCGYEHARGDQCEDCGKLLDPTDLVNPRCGTCSAEPHLKSTRHLYIDLPRALPKLQKWMDKASVDGFWAKNALKMTESWIRDGLKERCITRDLKWGIPVPKEGYEGKVFYVWFDAPIGYISITMCHTKEWEKWWRDPDNVELFQFIGKDNIPFHTVIFPCSQLATGEKWTMLHHMSSSEYLNYEDTKFSKSKGIGVFGNDCKDTGIPADVWRFYIYYNRPETSDFKFTWKDFQEKVNAELIGNLGNLVNRTLTFLNRFYDGQLPEGRKDEAFWKEVVKREEIIANKLDRAELRDGIKEILALSGYGNKCFQEGEPWRTRNEDPQAAADLLFNLVYLVRDLSILIRPYLPTTSDTLAGFIGWNNFDWSALGELSGLTTINKPELLFKQLEDDQIESLRLKYAGSQAERQADEDSKSDSKSTEASSKAAESTAAESTAAESTAEQFAAEIDIRAAKIIKVEQHPNAEKLYVINLDCAEEEERTICSGLVNDYTIEELTGKTILLVSNLKPAKLRGIKSNGMLLAAETTDEKIMEVLFVEAEPGTRVFAEGKENAPVPNKQIKIDRFFEIPLTVENNMVMTGKTILTLKGRPIKATRVEKGTVG